MSNKHYPADQDKQKLKLSKKPKEIFRIIGAAITIATITAATFPSVGFAENEAFATTQTRITLQGERIIFDGSVTSENGYDGLDFPDVEKIQRLLKSNPGIKTLEIKSEWGVTDAALDLAAIIIDYNLNTNVVSKCEGACTLVFIAGQSRTLELGARLGFRGTSWSRDSMKEYYENERESHGWMDEIAFASWAYEEGMRDFSKKVALLSSKGVDFEFINRMAYVGHDDIWYPTRDELVKFGLVHRLE
jgi:hypothetical protein